MSDEFDFSELRNYLQGQIDLGDGELFLDEPWALTRGKERLTPNRVAPMPVRQTSTVSSGGFSGLFNESTPNAQPISTPAPRSVKKTIAAYESADSMESFYACLKTDVLYAQMQSLPCYAGPENPHILFLLPAQQTGETCENFLQSAVGEMLTRLFLSLNIEASAIGVTYFFKGAPRAISPLLETSLRKMLSKEISLIKPQLMVTFGEPLFHQIFGKGKSFNDLAGTDLDFMGIKTISLVDPYAMVQDKQLKWLTWKVHIPRSSYFTK